MGSPIFFYKEGFINFKLDLYVLAKSIVPISCSYGGVLKGEDFAND